MSGTDDRQPPPRPDSPSDEPSVEIPAPPRVPRRPRAAPAAASRTTQTTAESAADASRQAPVAPAHAPHGHSTGLPPAAVSTQKPVGRYPGRHNPRAGDAVLTAILTLILYVLAVVYVRDALVRDSGVDKLLDGAQLSTILAVAAPIVLAVFSTVFSGLFILRRVLAFWLPIVAGILIVALYSVTQGMLDTAVINSF